MWKERRKKEGLTSVSPSRDNVGDALSTQKETNYASHAESPTVIQRRVLIAGSKSKIPIEEEEDLRGEKVSLKS